MEEFEEMDSDQIKYNIELYKEEDVILNKVDPQSEISIFRFDCTELKN